MKIEWDILNMLKIHANTGDYSNPHFLAEISRLLFEYYNLEDDTVDKWINDLFSR